MSRAANDSGAEYKAIFAERLKELRKRRGMTQSELAKLIAVSTNSISIYENGDLPSIGKLINLADAFGVSVDFLLGIEAEPIDSEDVEYCFSPDTITLGTLAREITGEDGNLKIDDEGNICATDSDISNPRLKRIEPLAHFLEQYYKYQQTISALPDPKALNRMYVSWLKNELEALDDIPLIE